MRLYTLQSLRGAACLLVVIYHVAAIERGYGLSFSPLRPALWFGYAGVDLFFVLSGFIITTTSKDSLGRPTRLPGYLIRRAWRIYPLYWLALAVGAAGMVAVLHLPPFATGDLRELLQAFVLLPAPLEPRIVAVSWSLGYELYFYLVFGCLYVLPRRLAAPLLAGWAIAVVVAAVAWPFESFAAQFALSPFVLEFLAGCLVAAVSPALSASKAGLLAACAAGWCAAASLGFYSMDPTWLPLRLPQRVLTFGVPAALLLYACTGRERHSGIRGPRWLERIGDASYSIYLFHTPGLFLAIIFGTWVGFSHLRVAHTFWIGMMIAAALVPGLLIHRFVEKPLLSVWRREKPRPAAEPAPRRIAA